MEESDLLHIGNGKSGRNKQKQHNPWLVHGKVLFLRRNHENTAVMTYNPNTIETLRMRAELGHQQIAQGMGHTTQEVIRSCRNHVIVEAV